MNHKTKTPLRSLVAVLLLAGLTSCQPTFQYNVIVMNKTDDDLRIAYKTKNDRRGLVEEVVTVKANEQRQIISTENIDTGDKRWASTAEHCNLVADYITASKVNGTKSTKRWCSDDIRFEKVDIQQAEFTLVYEPSDF